MIENLSIKLKSALERINEHLLEIIEVPFWYFTEMTRQVELILTYFAWLNPATNFWLLKLIIEIKEENRFTHFYAFHFRQNKFVTN